MDLTGTISLLLVGKTGSGKSTSGNMILQKEVFDTSLDCCSVTQECSQDRNTVKDITVQVMDTPGLFDTGKSQEEVGLRIVQCVINMHPGPDVILYVVRIGEKYTAQDFAAYRRFKMLLGSDVTGHVIVLFTGGDKLKKKGRNVEEFLQNVPSELRTVLDECGGRYAVLNNELTFAEGRAQVESLLRKAQEVKGLNGSKPYTCRNYGKIAKTVDGLEDLRRQVKAKLHKVEEREARASRHLQIKTAKYKEKLENLKLTQAEYDRRMKNFEKEVEEEKQRTLNKWLHEKEKEQRALEARKKEEEEKRRKEREEHELKIRKEKEEQERKIREEVEKRRKQQEKERKEQQKRLKEEEEERQRRAREQEREEELERAILEARRRHRERMEQAMWQEAVVGVCQLALRVFIGWNM